MDRLRDFALRRRALVPYEFPFTVPVVMYTGSLMIVGTAMAQRDFGRPWLLVATCLLALTPILLFTFIGIKPVPLIGAACVLVAVGVLLSWPPIFLDAAPFLLMFMVGEVFALGSLRDGLLASAASALLLVGAARTGHLSTFVPYLLFFLAVAAMIGRILQLQQRLVLKERDRQAALAQQAAADERRRIAREIHDVIAHSLSVTMLHLTGARRALQQDHDVGEAVDGLLDAERLGRQAMSDIRRTVGLLGAPEGGPAQLTPEPGMSDIPALVATFADAGLRVESRLDDTPGTVTAGVGLTLYRVAQESLANIAKHAPDSTVQLRLRVDTDTATLSVHNDLARPIARVQPGAGLPGMRQRVEILDGEFEAGPDPGGWTVRASVPIIAAVDPQACLLRRNLFGRNEVRHE